MPKNIKNIIHKEEFEIKNYELFCSQNVEKNSGRGSLLYIHNSLISKQIIITTDKHGNYFEENVLAEISINNKDKLLCGVFYRRGESSSVNNKRLLNTLEDINEKKHSHVLLMGDFNLPNINWTDWTTKSLKPECYENQFIEGLRDSFLFQHVTDYTRQRGNDEPSTLDLVLSNEENMVQELQIKAPLGKSDHSTLEFNYICDSTKEAPKIKTMYHKGNYSEMKEELNINWQDEFDKYPNDVERQWKFFNEKYQNAVDKHVPKKIMTVNGKNHKKFTIPLNEKNLKLLKRKNALWSKVRKGLADEEQKLGYRRLTNQIKSLTRKGKRTMEKTIAKESKRNPKSFWRYAQTKLKTRAGMPDLEIPTENGKKFTKNDQEKADTLQDYFSSVFTQESLTNLPPFGERDFKEELINMDITESMVKDKFKKLKVNKSPGPDKIHPRVLHEIADIISTPVTYIFNTSLRNKTLPTEWKRANVAAIFKKGSKSQPKNYRPVSLTAVLCKVLESILRDAIIDHMKKNNLFSDKQFGFIGGRSTMLQLLKVLDIWTEILDQGGTIDTIYCDFMKAFDKVPHHRLLFKVEQYGIRGNILGWIKDFLSNRTQEIIINENRSKPANVTSGIPQGSVLGPILFVLYINDLPEVVDKDTFIFLFADDTKAFRQIKTQQDNVQLQKDIDNMVAWSNIWLLKFHPEKCIMMALGNRSDSDWDYTMDGHALGYSQCEKDLGVFIDKSLSFDKHINHVINKANRIMGIARRTFECMDEEIFKYIYKGLVRPQLEYAHSVWAPHHAKHIEALESVQRRATKTVPGLAKLDYDKRLRKLKLPTLAYRRIRGDMIQVFKLTSPTAGYDKTLPPFFELSQNTDLRGHSKKLEINRCKKDVGKYSFSHRVKNIWNKLPEDVIAAGDLLQFEKKLDNHWKNEPILYDNHRAEIKKYHPLGTP